DVLTGLIGGLLAQGLPYQVAAQQGVAWHASSGLQLTVSGAGSGLIARDLLNYRGPLCKSLPDLARIGAVAVRLA
ncbi:MAG: hypothetical protein HY692_08110, partial [Cyanobacteria bacterium NC_groundwater_1444_Ag_S-0.65um_54_12]|nr:hypothetical protein [Cyanobacteria bacterium NC_groundwater_1444_Ag_S-0.65um_54_12]